MRSETRTCEVFPRVILADETVILRIVPQVSNLFLSVQDQLLVLHLPFQEPTGQNVMDNSLEYNYDTRDGSLHVTAQFSGEQEHRLGVYSIPVDYANPLAVVSLYSLQSDLLCFKPYKGDMHMHSVRSDGKDEPAHVAAACRRIGLDFMALTDHRQYGPSLEAIAAYDQVVTDLKMYPGEEVHAPGNPLHIINFGGSFGVNELCKQPSYEANVELVAASLGELPSGVDRKAYAASCWVFNQIRKAEGLGIYCHPYWISVHEECRQAYYINEALISHLFNEQPFDAFELLGGYHLNESEANILQVARYHEEQAKGKKIPVVGVSDAHGCETGQLFGWFYTIVFAADNTLPSLIEAIRQRRSVAVEALPDEIVRVYGPFRLVKYALFLLREVFPEHDQLCCREGEMMLSYIHGNKTAAVELAGMHGKCDALMTSMILQR